MDANTLRNSLYLDKDFRKLSLNFPIEFILFKQCYILLTHNLQDLSEQNSKNNQLAKL